ncbi:MAG TPA: metallophosphoesterase family protein [archaeon]|nr:metallophosphoesterase family protein [archaeon]
MSIAIMSDFHANLEAAEAVFRDRDSLNRQGRGIDKTYCLGDLVDYGANPREVIDLVRKECDLVLSGNHDADVAGRKVMPMYRGHVLEDYIGIAEVSYWTREKLNGYRMERKTFLTRFGIKTSQSASDWLATLSTIHKEGDITYVHANPIDGLHLNGYFMMSEIETLAEVVGIHPMIIVGHAFASFGKLCFIGHTHVPETIIKDDEQKRINIEWISGPKRFNMDRKYQTIINVGSVGQPRDRDNRACYVVFDGETAEFRRVEYDVQKAVEKIRAEEIDPRHADRLFVGV